MIDEYSSRLNLARVTECQRTNAKHGFFNGSTPPYGYVAISTDVHGRSGFKKKLQIQHSEAELVRRIFDLAEFGEMGVTVGMKRIVQKLNSVGELCRGRKWTVGQVERILKNRVYVGEYVTFRRNAKKRRERPVSEWVTVMVPAILWDIEQFDRVQQALASRRLQNTEAKSKQVRTVLTGLLVCSRCGKRLTLMSGKSGWYQYYCGATRLKSGPKECDCPNLPREETEAAILAAICANVLKPARVATVLNELKEQWKKQAEPNRRKMLELGASVAALEAQLATLYGQVSTGALEMEQSLKDFIHSIQRKLEVARENIAMLKSRQHVGFWKFGEKQLDEFLAAAR